MAQPTTDELDEQMTKAEIQDELRERGMKVSGNKEEVAARLADAMADESQDDRDGGSGDVDERAEGGPRDERDAAGSRDRPSASGRLGPMQAARRAAAQLAELRGQPIEGIAGIEVLDGETRVLVEVLELQRTPRSSDVLGVYEVVVDGRGSLQAATRLRRYVRGQAGEDVL